MTDDRKNRRISLKEIFAVVTYFAVASALIGLGVSAERELFWIAGGLMFGFGAGGVIGFALDGRADLAPYATVAIVGIIVAILSLMIPLALLFGLFIQAD